MASCSICARETCDEPMPRDPNVKYSQGDFYSLRESVYTPIYDILRSTFSALGGESDAWKRNQHSFEALTSVPDVIKDGRPAVVMQDEDDHPQGLRVCVATTYNGEDVSKLPLIFRHFSIPIAFNNHIFPNHLDHLHALPEWERKNAYIIAWQFRSRAIRESIWTRRADGEEVPQALGKDAIEFLIKECNKRWEQWEEMCKDPTMASKLESDLRRHVARRQKQKRLSAGGSMTSVNSIPMGINSPSWRGPSTIPEEPQDNVVPGTTGNPQKPEPWKVVTKNRPGSVRSVSSAFSKKKGANWDKFSTKSNRSRSSFSQKPHNVSGMFNFDLLLGIKRG